MTQFEMKDYVEAALRLKSAIDLNQQDTDFVGKENGNEIIYIFDTNVFIFYATLEDRELTRDISHLVGQLDDSVSRAMERLTGDFIFSGKLPGQLRRHAYISVPHLDETLRTAHAIGQDIDEADLAARGPAAPKKSDVELMKEILASNATPATKIAELSEVVPAAWLATLRTATRFSSAMWQAFLAPKPLLVPLDKYENEKGRLAGHVDPAEAAAWADLLPAPSPERTEANIQRDAKTLATIVNLYRNDPLSRGGKATRRYLFVTTDDAIAEAVRRNGKWLRRNEIKMFVRSPRDYLPILNLTAMREALAGVPVADRIRSEFKSVFNMLRSALDWIVIGQRAAPPDSLSMAMLDRVRENWSEIARYVTTLNAYHFAADHQKVFENLAAFVSQTDTAVAAARLVRETVEEVRDHHLEMMATSAIAAISKVRAAKPVPAQIRAQIKLVGPLFGDILGDEGSINTFLKKAVRSGELPDATLQKLKQSPGTRETQLFAACLFVAAEQWKTAVDFATRAVRRSVEAGTLSPEMSEARYLRALCLRFSMDSAAAYVLARKDLLHNLRDYGSNPAMDIRRLRDEIELGTVMVTAAVMQEISIAQQQADGHRGRILELVERGKPATVFRAGVEMLQAARKGLQDPRLPGARESRLTKAERNELLQNLRYQCTTNLVGAFAFERIVPSLELKPRAVQSVLPLLATMANWRRRQEAAGETPRPTAGVYQSLAESLNAKSLPDRLRAYSKTRRCIGQRRPRQTGMPLDDYLEYTFIWDWLQAQLTLIKAASGVGG